eukprot:2630126-Prymnesium_polylepis.1
MRSGNPSTAARLHPPPPSPGGVVRRRNTDNAWIETTAYHFHCSLELGAMLMLNSQDVAGRRTMQMH